MKEEYYYSNYSAIIILGGILTMLIYHFLLYYFNRDKLLFHYNLYLFFTLLLIVLFSDIPFQLFGEKINSFILIKFKESLQILYLTFYYNFIVKSIEIENYKNTFFYKLWRFFFNALILYSLFFAIYVLFFVHGEYDKTVPFLISRLSMFLISLFLLKKCFELRNLTFQKYILFGSSTYFVFGLIAFFCSITRKNFLGIPDILWLFIGSFVDIIFFALALSYRNRLKLVESIKTKVLLDLEKANNQQLNNLNNTLKTLNTELIVSEEKLQHSNNSKEQLISMMSHDLLNPIIAITNYNQQIISRKNNSDELLQAFKTVDAAIQPMHGLLDNMLQWTAIQKDGIATKLKNQDVNNIVKEIIGIYRPQAQLKFIKLIDFLDTDFVQETDKSILSLILRNLLNNAIKYSGNETEIEILSDTKSKTITIKDQGFGMTDEMIGYLNTKQLDKIESRGTGLGLKLCYEFAEAIGAAIVFERNEVGGVTVDLKLKI